MFKILRALLIFLVLLQSAWTEMWLIYFEGPDSAGTPQSVIPLCSACQAAKKRSSSGRNRHSFITSVALGSFTPKEDKVLYVTMKNTEIFCPTLNKSRLNNDSLKMNCNWNQLKFITKHWYLASNQTKSCASQPTISWECSRQLPSEKALDSASIMNILRTVNATLTGGKTFRIHNDFEREQLNGELFWTRIPI